MNLMNLYVVFILTKDFPLVPCFLLLFCMVKRGKGLQSNTCEKHTRHSEVKGNTKYKLPGPKYKPKPHYCVGLCVLFCKLLYSVQITLDRVHECHTHKVFDQRSANMGNGEICHTAQKEPFCWHFN